MIAREQTRREEEVARHANSVLVCNAFATLAPDLRTTWPCFDGLFVDEGQDHDTCWHSEVRTLPSETGGWWHIYQILLKEGRNDPPVYSMMRPSTRPSAPPGVLIPQF